MMLNPRLGQQVQIKYRKKTCHHFPVHGKTGVIVTVGKGKPRNHLVDVDGELYIVPCGNLIRTHRFSTSSKILKK